MLTVPVIWYTGLSGDTYFPATGNVDQLGPPAETLRYLRQEGTTDNEPCRSIGGSATPIYWSGNVTLDASGVANSPSSLTGIEHGATIFGPVYNSRYEPGTITYPDGDGNFARVIFRPQGTFHASFSIWMQDWVTEWQPLPNTPSPGYYPIIGIDPSSITVIFQTSGGNLEVILTWQAWRYYWEGSLHNEGFPLMDVHVGGVSAGTLSAVQITGDIDNFTVKDSAEVDRVLGIQFMQYGGSVTVPISSDAIEVRLRNSYGQVMPWKRFKVRPVALFTDDTADIDDPIVTFDASDSYGVGSGLAAQYDWRVTNDFSMTPIEVTTTTPIWTYDFTELVELYSQPGPPYGGNGESADFYVYLYVYSDQGCQSPQLQRTITVSLLDETMGAVMNFAGIHFKAENDGQDVQVSRDLGSGTFEDCYTLEGHRNPTVYQLSGVDTLYLIAQRRSDNHWRLLQSHDAGESFTFMSEPFDANVKKVVSLILSPDGTHIAVGQRTNTTPKRIVSKASEDGVTWGTESDVLTSADNVKSLTVYSENPVDSSRVWCRGTGFSKKCDSQDGDGKLVWT